MRCACCHNPDTWDPAGGTTYDSDEIISRVLRCRDYFGEEGGITLSGGEPLLQAAFAREIFERCRAAGINTCLDTSGVILNDDVRALLSVTDRVLLDVKYTNEEGYREHVGASMHTPLAFLSLLNERGIPTRLRQVTIPTKTDDRENILRLRDLAAAHPCVERIELLPLRKICAIKYEAMGIPFPFAALPEPTSAEMAALRAHL